MSNKEQCRLEHDEVTCVRISQVFIEKSFIGPGKRNTKHNDPISASEDFLVSNCFLLH